MVGDTRPQPLDPEIEPRLYVPWSQASSRTLRVIVRANEPAQARVGLVRAITAADPALAAETPTTGTERMALALWPVWFFDGFVLVFAVFAIIVSMVGVYGMTRYVVLARRQEIAIRVALGAAQHTIVELLARHSGIPVLVGILLGLSGAVIVSRLVGAAVPGATTVSVPVIAAVAVLVGGVAVLAVVSPVRNALRVDPIDVLRQE